MSTILYSRIEFTYLHNMINISEAYIEFQDYIKNDIINPIPRGGKIAKNVVYFPRLNLV